MKSKREDGRGHWVRGKPRSTLDAAEVSRVLPKLNRALQDQSARAVGPTLGIAGTQVSRIVRGEDLPSERTAELVMQCL